MDAFRIEPETLEPLIERLVPSGLDYRWVFLNVARKLGVVPCVADPRDLRALDPLLQASRTTPLGEETLDKTLHDRYDIAHARQLLESVRDGRLSVVPAPPGPLTDGPLERLRGGSSPTRPRRRS